MTQGSRRPSTPFESGKAPFDSSHHGGGQQGTKDLFLCLLSALLLILSFPTFNLEFLAWISFIPLFFALKNKSKIQVFFLSYLTGVLFWLGTVYWLIHVTFFGMILLVLYLALYFGIFGLFFSFFALRSSFFVNLFFVPSFWVILEYTRSRLLTGFPWALLGYSQYLNLPVIQIADITGVWGISFLVMMVNVTFYSGIGYRVSGIGKIKGYTISILCILVVLFYGYYKLHRTPNTEHRTPLKISVIQGNIPQELKWNPRAKNFIIDKYLQLSAQAAKDHPDLIIWPEAALPVIPQEEPEFLNRVESFSKKLRTPLLLGAVTVDKDFYYNSALLISREGTCAGTYDKIHLVPFGEYIPLRKIFSFLENIVPIGEIARGKEYTVFNFENNLFSQPVSQSAGQPVMYDPQTGKPANWQTKFSVLICFEDLFPELSREFTRRGADFLINITNDAWFGKTRAPYQHLQASVFRAVENRVFLVRCANTGVSGFISPAGKIVSLVSVYQRCSNPVNIFIDGYKTERINITKNKQSFYTRYGDIFVLLCFVFVLLYLYIFAFKKQFPLIRD